jgi:hypothetical protein
MPRRTEEVDHFRAYQSFRSILLAITKRRDNAFIPLLLVQREGDFGQQRGPPGTLHNNVTHRQCLKMSSESQVEEDDHHD